MDLRIGVGDGKSSTGEFKVSCIPYKSYIPASGVGLFGLIHVSLGHFIAFWCFRPFAYFITHLAFFKTYYYRNYQQTPHLLSVLSITPLYHA